jgi:SurA N-terminal domain
VRRSVDVPRTSIKLAAAVLAAGVAVAACGTVKMGAAAIVGNQRISATNLSGEVSNLSTGYRSYSSQITLQYPVSEMPQEVLAWLVRFQVRDRLAEREGITVTPAEVQQALAAITAQIRQSGSTATLPEIAVANGLPPDMITALGRYQAIETKLLNRLDGGKLPTALAAQQALEARFNGSQCRAAKSLDIQINPQFGTLDYRSFAIVPAPTTLSEPQTSAPTPAASKPALTPPC